MIVGSHTYSLYKLSFCMIISMIVGELNDYKMELLFILVGTARLVSGPLMAPRCHSGTHKSKEWIHQTCLLTI